MGFSVVFPHVPWGNAAPRLLSLDQGAQGAAVQAGLSLRVPARGKSEERHGKIMGNLWKIYGKYGKSMENMGNLWKIMGNYMGQSGKIMGK